MTHVPEKLHAELGASAAARWMACPGSVRLSRGIPNVETEYAREGTAAHALAELALRRGVDAFMWEGLTLEGVEVTEDMANAVQVFVDYCNLLKDMADVVWTEHRFSLAALNPPGPMFGTADFCAYDPRLRELEVVDFKYGQGVVVEAAGNRQLKYYALGAALSLGNERPIETVRMTIVQPRAAHPAGVVRSEQIGILDLLAFASELLEAARATLADDAPLSPGHHCRFCPAAAICPAQHAQAQAIAQVEFAEMPLDRPPAPETLPLPVLADILEKLPILEDWAKQVRAHVTASLERGDAVPGFKLVPKRATRRWASQEQARTWLLDAGWKDEEILKLDLRSPAQIEKLVGKKQLPGEFVESKSSGYTLAREEDPRPAVDLTPGIEFPALPA